MPTKKPRMLITLEPDNHRALKMLAGLSGKSVSSLINEVLKPSLDPLLSMVRLARDPAQTDLVEYLEIVKGRMDTTLQEVSLGLSERAQRALPIAAGAEAPGSPSGVSSASPGEGGAGRASTPRSASSAPPSEVSFESTLTPSSNTGVTSTRSEGNQRVSKPGRKVSSR